MITHQVRLITLTPTAEIINGRVRIHEYDDTVQTFGFQLKSNIPWTPICDELVKRMREYAANMQAVRDVQDSNSRNEIKITLKRDLGEFTAQVENELNRMMGIR